MIFADGGVLDLAVAGLHGLLDFVDDDVGMGVGRGENQCLAGQARIDVLGQFLGDDAIELLR